MDERYGKGNWSKKSKEYSEIKAILIMQNHQAAEAGQEQVLETGMLDELIK